MPYFLLGMLGLFLAMATLRGFARANPAVVAMQLRKGAGVVVLAGAGVLLVRGLAGYAFSLAALGSWLIWGSSLSGTQPFGRRGSAAPGKSSRVATAYLDVTLDHETGAIEGRVLKGPFANRRLESLKPIDCAALWRECRFADPQSAQILEAYMDASHPGWRDDHARSTGEAGADPSQPSSGGPMTRTEALDVLGLSEGAVEDDIRRAHRELMQKNHPDRGGSTYLAAKINEAKAVLLR